MSRRPRGEAAQKILDAFGALNARSLSIRKLLTHTELPVRTLDNLKLLARQGKVEIYRDDDNRMWVQLSD